MVMKMEFEDEDGGDSQDLGLAARLTKKVKKESTKEKGTECRHCTTH